MQRFSKTYLTSDMISQWIRTEAYSQKNTLNVLLTVLADNSFQTSFFLLIRFSMH